MYHINIQLEPESFNSVEYYFWCILKNINGTDCNCGHGWSKSISEAATDAMKYFEKNLQTNHTEGANNE